MNRVKASFKCPFEYKSKFSNSSCLMTISVGQSVHEGDKFAACVDIVNYNFKACTILVDDSLQRFSMAIDSGLTAEDHYQQSIIEGDLWLERSKPIYKKMNNLQEILRWDDWIKHPKYNEVYAKINDLYNTCQNYKKAIDETAEIYVNRYMTRLINKTIDYNKAVYLSIDYLKEECAALCLWTEGNYDFEVYPSKRNLAMNMTHAQLIAPKTPYLLLPVAIKLKYKSEQLENSINHSEQNTLPVI